MYQPENYFQKKRGRFFWLIIPIVLLAAVIYGIGLQLVGPWARNDEANLDLVVEAGEQWESLPTEVEQIVPTTTPETAVYAPDFILPDLYDEDINYILSQYKGRPVILNFWASWCGPCRVEMPAFQSAYERYKDDGLVILAVNQTFIDDADQARSFAAEMGLTFPLARDEDGRISESLYGVRGLPTTVVIRADGTTAFAQIGPMTDEKIADVSRRLVRGETVP